MKEVYYKYPYLLKNMNIQAWCSDISYVKLPQGHVYIVAIVDIYSRRILDYAISNTLEAEFCIRCLERCIQKYGAPVIFNTVQGVQYTSHGWINVLERNNIIISMDGKGRWADMFGLNACGAPLSINVFLCIGLKICQS